MKLTFTRGFDVEQTIKKFKEAKVEGVEDFVNSIAESLDKLSQFVSKNISLADNIDQSSKTYLMYHGRVLAIEPPAERKKVKAILITQTSDWDKPLLSFNWRYNLSGKIELRAEFKDAPTGGINVTMSIFH